MAGKKGVAVALQTEVNTEDEWAKILEREGLVVVDVYSEWCGPCVGMVGNLKKLKLEIGSDYLHLAVAKSDSIEALKRFRNKSEPTWMFIASGHMVNLMFGANAPRLMRLIAQELDKETKVLKGERERQTIPFDELTEEEKNRLDEIMRKEEIEKEREAKELGMTSGDVGYHLTRAPSFGLVRSVHLSADALEELKIRNLTRLAKLLLDKTVMVYFPHMIDDHGTCNAAFKMLAQYDQVTMTVHDQMEVQLTKADIPELFFDCDIHLPETFLALLESKPCLASLLMYHGIQTTDSGSSLPLHLSQVEERLGSFVYGHLSHTEPPVMHTVAFNFEQTKENGEIWPGVWTPLTFLSKAAAVKVLFPQVRVGLEFKEEQLPPPRYCMVFDASRANEINDVIEEYPDAIINLGFFDSMDPNSAKKVAKNMKQLDKIGTDKIKHIKMVMAVAKKTSDPLLAFSQLTPLYVSPDTKIGSKECNLFFPPADLFEEEEEEEMAEDEEIEGEEGEEGEEREGGVEYSEEGGGEVVETGSDGKSLASQGNVSGEVEQAANSTTEN